MAPLIQSLTSSEQMDPWFVVEVWMLCGTMEAWKGGRHVGRRENGFIGRQKDGWVDAGMAEGLKR